MYKGAAAAGEGSSEASRRRAAQELAELLQAAAAEASKEGTANADAALLQQAVHGSMAERLAAWLLADGAQSAQEVCQRELLGTSLLALPAASRAHHISTAAAALGEVLG
jgi:hypothetical protein